MSPLPLFNGGEMRRDFTYIDDIVRGVVACLDSPPLDDGSIKAGGSISAACALQYRQQPQRGPDAARRDCSSRKPAERHCSIHGRCKPGDVKDTFADISAIERDLGFRPTITIDEGVPRFVAWYRDYHGLIPEPAADPSASAHSGDRRADVHRLEPETRHRSVHDRASSGAFPR